MSEDRVYRSADRLEDAIQKATTRALEELIPPWCVGISPAFWKTTEGRLIANALWLLNHYDAVSLAAATRIVYPFLEGLPIEIQRQRGLSKLRSRVSRILFHYPLPDAVMVPNIGRRRSSFSFTDSPYYMLRSEAEEMHVREQKRHEAIEEHYRQKAEREAHLRQQDLATSDEPAPRP